MSLGSVAYAHAGNILISLEGAKTTLAKVTQALDPAAHTVGAERPSARAVSELLTTAAGQVLDAVPHLQVMPGGGGATAHAASAAAQLSTDVAQLAGGELWRYQGAIASDAETISATLDSIMGEVGPALQHSH